MFLTLHFEKWKLDETEASLMASGREGSGWDPLESMPLGSERGQGCGGAMQEVDKSNRIPKHQVP